MSANNLTPQSSKISLADIETRNKHKGAIIWFTGLSGSGKSTIATETELKLFEKGINVYVLDGDNLRMGLNKGLTFSDDDRKENIRRAAEVAKLFYQAGFVVICGFISPFNADREEAKALVPADRFFEVFIKCSIEECIKRDPKNLYKKAIGNRIPNFTGISSPYEVPVNPELIINTETTPVIDAVKLITDMLYLKGIINDTPITGKT
ncbi:adenylyl-sulfate kinase [Mucilaginibacter sp. HMF5004]|uniref:adenylyl-sulfate kinase n=1 Tax=Mucilaginibacter rivuli TaxID=2857527 RepID=UPI001C5FD469|nr:adenylyl-sulfate kinase [Mucilaginibacter rivuli]MBW4889258.1 adenylyl-sulfate kinase [Mucilaginibacter rivuli]